MVIIPLLLLLSPLLFRGPQTPAFNGGIGKMYSNITGLSLGVSATIGLATFCSQAEPFFLF